MRDQWTITTMPYNHEITPDGKLRCAYAISPENPMGYTDYARINGAIMIDLKDNASCRGCMRDLPRPATGDLWIDG